MGQRLGGSCWRVAGASEGGEPVWGDLSVKVRSLGELEGMQVGLVPCPAPMGHSYCHVKMWPLRGLGVNTSVCRCRCVE